MRRLSMHRLAALLAFLLAFTVNAAHALEWGELEGQIKTTIQSLHLGPHSIETKYRSGTLTVSGYVATEAERERVVTSLATLRGVSEIEDKLTVQAPDVATEGGGEDLASLRKSILEAIKSQKGLGSYEVNVATNNSEVELTGVVSKQADRTRIAQIAQKHSSGRTVINKISVKAPPSDAELATRVRAALEQEGDLDLTNVTLEARGGVVIFSGSRPNHREIDRILSIANMTEGVEEVRSEMRIR